MSNEALRLADALDSGSNYSRSLTVLSAAELRRLHGENESLHREADKLTAELSAALSEARRLHASNAELLEALQSVLAAAVHYQLRKDEQCVLDALDAIANATKEPQ